MFESFGAWLRTWPDLLICVGIYAAILAVSSAVAGFLLLVAQLVFCFVYGLRIEITKRTYRGSDQ